jgi:hypothetical protein
MSFLENLYKRFEAKIASFLFSPKWKMRLSKKKRRKKI